MKSLRDTYREWRGVVQAATEAQIKNARTLGTMKAELVKLKADLDDVTIGTQEWTNQARNIRRLTDEISIAEQKTGDFRRNVGNYSGDIQRAFAAMGVSTGKFGQAIMFLTTSQSGLTQKTLLFARSLSTVQKALLATGIGGFIVLLGVLIANWEKIINLFKTATQRAKEYAEPQRDIFEKFEEDLS